MDWSFALKLFFALQTCLTCQNEITKTLEKSQNGKCPKTSHELGFYFISGFVKTLAIHGALARAHLFLGLWG
jgi:hypothetical protein